MSESKEITETESPVATLRDQFAMAALQGIISDPSTSMNEATIDRVAEAAFMYADAMMEARES
jgi:hypothetical protein